MKQKKKPAAAAKMLNGPLKINGTLQDVMQVVKADMKKKKAR